MLILKSNTAGFNDLRLINRLIDSILRLACDGEGGYLFLEEDEL